MVEVVVAMLIIAIIVPAINAVLNWSVIQSVKAREQTRASRLAQMISARTRSMDFYDIFVSSPAVNPVFFADSSLPGFGIPQYSDYPGRFHLEDMQKMVLEAGFTHFTINVAHMRRDSTNTDPDQTNDLVPFADGNGDLLDDKDPALKYEDKNGDGDFFDAPLDPVTNQRKAEQPDTRLKRLSIRIWRRGQSFAHKQGELLSAELFTGEQGVSAESQLKLIIMNPPEGAVVYKRDTLSQRNAQDNIPLVRPYGPDAPPAVRGDAASPLAMDGETEPAGDVQAYLGESALAKDLLVGVGMSGDFTGFALPLLTAGLQEGANALLARTFKATLASPYARIDLLVDSRPPLIQDPRPGVATVKTLSPFLGALFIDDKSSTDTVSGLALETVTMTINGTAVEHEALSDGYVVWRDTTTLLPHKLTDGNTYTLRLVGGDYALYKASHSWTFAVNTNAGGPGPQLDALAVTPAGFSFTLRDDHSGINASTLRVLWNGTEVIGAATPQMGIHFDARAEVNGGKVSYSFPTPAAAGDPYTLDVQVRNWNGGDISPAEGSSTGTVSP